MARSREVGDWIRNARIRKKIRSAAALGRLARLSASHIAMFERGEVIPRGKTALKLSKALKLNNEEQAEFLMLITSAREPSGVRSALASPIPGAAMWRHLPALLFQIPHHGFRQFDFYPDMILVDAVRAAGSLLAWLAITTSPPGAKSLGRVRDQVQRWVEEAAIEAERQPNGEQNEPVWIAATALPHVWRAHIFSDFQSTAKLSRLISEWSFHPPVFPDQQSIITIRLKDQAMDRNWAVWTVEPSRVADLHDAMLVVRLWRLLDLAASLGPPNANVYRNRCKAKDDLATLISLGVDEVRRFREPLLTDDREHTAHLEKGVEYSQIAAHGLFAARVLADPELWRQLYNADPPYTQEQVRSHAQQIASAFCPPPTDPGQSTHE